MKENLFYLLQGLKDNFYEQLLDEVFKCCEELYIDEIKDSSFGRVYLRKS